MDDASDRLAAAETALATALQGVVGRLYGAGAQIKALQRLSGGAMQELWAFDVPTGDGVRELILRRSPGGVAKRQVPGTGMEMEARVLRLAVAAGVPAPRVEYAMTPSDGLGSAYIMERIPGETLAPRILRGPEYAQARTRLAFQLGAAAAKIHRIDVDAAGDLNRATPAESVASAYERYRALGMDRPVFEWAFRWFRDHIPSADFKPSVVHGDLRTGNIIVGPEGLRSVLDWEATHVGDPMEDLAWLCIPPWRFGELDKPAGGVGTREELFAGYEAESGQKVDPERVRFWEAFGSLRWGLATALMARDFQAGDRSVERAAIGRRTSENEIDLLAILAPEGRAHA
ncbi:phosphotransferase family protein [uncultured Phenylobacterium sp.]|uniref:phosphotransferase family protein n=1 Tax=uncultured Phenylobacterium sp. TaxID=349273 RepID=UPI0026003111|nr:phosphotransferase family protein [uncultured Phenylobacterium sp.]